MKRQATEFQLRVTIVMKVMVAMEAAIKFNQIMDTAKEVMDRVLDMATNLNLKRNSKYSFTSTKQKTIINLYLNLQITRTPIVQALSAITIKIPTR